jgi:plasmid rolling circle replication initiator protein Rep
LEVIAKYASVLDAKLEARQLLRYKLQDQAGYLLPGERVSKCLRWRVPVKDRVEIWRSEEVKKAHYKNLMICGSVWMCPVCAAKITERRRVEVEKAIQDQRFQKVMVTFTLRHNKCQSLKNLYGGISKIYRDIKVGNQWIYLKKRSGIVASIRGAEVTYGFENGWHPHFHVVFFIAKNEEEMTQAYKDRFTWEITQLYAGKVAKNGFEMLSGVGVKVGFDQDHVSSYAAKWGMDQELVKSPAKIASGEHYAPFQILLESAKDQDPDKKFDRLFFEYAYAMKGKRQLVWSKGARELFDLGSEISDMELAEKDVDPAVFFAGIIDVIWKNIVVAKVRGKVLRAADYGDRELFLLYLAELGIDCSDQDLFLREVNMQNVEEKEKKRKVDTG